MRVGLHRSRNKALRQTWGSAPCWDLTSKTDPWSLSKPCCAGPCPPLQPWVGTRLVPLAPAAIEGTASVALHR